jgi:hypothetical protein
MSTQGRSGERLSVASFSASAPIQEWLANPIEYFTRRLHLKCLRRYFGCEMQPKRDLSFAALRHIFERPSRNCSYMIYSNGIFCAEMAKINWFSGRVCPI